MDVDRQTSDRFLCPIFNFFNFLLQSSDDVCVFDVSELVAFENNFNLFNNNLCRFFTRQASFSADLYEYVVDINSL